MRLYIPRCGEGARLDTAWTFTLHPEHRNEAFRKALKELSKHQRHLRDVTLPEGTELVFDRLYIRQGADEFASVTFIVKACSNEPLVGERFWVKLEDANRLELTFTSSDNPVGGLAKATYKAALKAAADPKVMKKRQASADSRVALGSARDYIRGVCNGNVGGAALYQHVTDIVIDVCRTTRASMRPVDPTFVRLDMSSFAYSGKKRHAEAWPCKTTSGPDGTVVREFRYRWNGVGYGGFRLTMRGTEVLSCEPVT